MVSSESCSAGFRRIAALIAYDGGSFAGFQAQDRCGVAVRTVQSELERCMAGLVHGSSRFTAAGRTDAGVHASGQVVHVDAPAEFVLDGHSVGAALNARLAGDVRVLHCWRPEGDFHARFDARSRVYRFSIINGPVCLPVYRRTAWHVRAPLNVSAMSASAEALVGLHDFVAFGAREDHRGTIRRIFRVRVHVAPVTALSGDYVLLSGEGRDGVGNLWHTYGTGREFGCGGALVFVDVEATGFIRHMMRRIVGALVRVGLGQSHGSVISEALRSRDKSLVGAGAPAHGLDLVHVVY